MKSAAEKLEAKVFGPPRGEFGNEAPAPRRAWRLNRRSVFWAVLVGKIALGAAVASHYARDLFLPFLDYFIESGFRNPWAHFAALGRTDSFPYPPLMLYLLAVPQYIFHALLPPGVASESWAQLLALRIPLLVADLGIWAVLRRWFPTKHERILWLYWCSPIAIYICYWHGQLDVIPTALFLGCLHLLREKRFTWALLLYAAGLATKSHLLSALPFLALYTFQERRWRGTIKAFGIATAAYLLLVSPFLADPAFRQMVFATGEQTRLFALQVNFGPTRAGVSLFLAPAAILLLLFRFAAYPKWNWDLFTLQLGLLFCVFVLLIPPAPGYFLWSLPFVVYYLCRQTKMNLSLYLGYVGFYLVYQLTSEEPGLADTVHRYLPSDLAAHFGNFIFTLMESSLGAMILGMYSFGTRSNAFYSLRTSPVMIGLAGDSGAGKDHLVRLLLDLFGAHRTTVTSGDDYHRWPRGDGNWNTHTHLDVKANDLYQEHEHALELARGKMVVRKTYDHHQGKILEGRAVDSNGYLIFSGLHSLSLGELRNLYDLTVFLDPEESLRQTWKIERDTKERHHSVARVKESIAHRQKDREKYILPQPEHAEMVVRFFRWSESAPELALEVRAGNSFNWVALAERLSMIPTLEVKHEPYCDTQWQKLTIRGEAPAALLSRICHDYIPNLEEIARKPQLADGLEGCLQILFLRCLSDKLRWKMP